MLSWRRRANGLEAGDDEESNCGAEIASFGVPHLINKALTRRQQGAPAPHLEILEMNAVALLSDTVI